MEQPIQIHIEQYKLDDLKTRMLQTRWVDAAANNTWKNGVSISYLRELTDYWANTFDWRKVEDQINAYPNFITTIDDIDIHYLHIKSASGNAVPLIITHGWPGSFLEMMKIIPLLTKDDDISFDLVIPSLPGFGFSGKPTTRSFHTDNMAGLWVKLMKQLGYEKFIAQGGDMGAFVSTHIALKHPESLIGLHLNYIPFTYKPYLQPGEKLTAAETAAMQQTAKFFQAEGAYAHVQSTKPVTLAYALNDSPVGLCAWILQLFHSFSDMQQPIEKLFTKDELLANITLYWLTQTIYSSMHFYETSMEESLQFKQGDFIHVPVGIAHYPFPDSFPHREYIERGYNVQLWKDMPTGGHFAALEQPGLFANDIKTFAETILAVHH